jgi:Mg2+/Co2+ transporter CorB
MNGINIAVNDIVLIKKINNNDSDKVVVGKLGTVSNNILPIYSNNADAISGGLSAGMYYRTGADPDVVCVVH